MIGGVKSLTSFFENLSGSKAEYSQKITFPIQQYSNKQSPLKQESPNRLVQTGDAGNSDKSNGSEERSSNAKDNESLLGKIYSKMPSLFKGTEYKLEKSDKAHDKDPTDTTGGKTQTKQAEERRYRTRSREEIQRSPKEGVEQDGGHLLGSNRNIAYLVGDDQEVKSVTAETCKGQTSTRSVLHRQIEGVQVKGGKSQSESTYASRSSMQSSDDRNNEVIGSREEKLTQKKNKQWNSTTTISSSGIYTGSVTDRSAVPEDRRRAESDGCRTKKYVEKISTFAEVPSFKKCPSEPTVMPHPKQKTLTQENILNLRDNSVSFFTSGNESVTVSQTSVFSSSEQETRDAIAKQTGEYLQEHEKSLKGPDERRLKRVTDVLEREGIVFILGDEGSGSTYLAWTLFLNSNTKEKYNLLEVSDFAACSHTKETVTILVDGAFGESKLQDTDLETCLKYAKMCKMKKSTRNMKLIFTVKHHIADQCKRQLDDFRKCIVDLEDPNLQLTSDEMFEISKAIVHNNREELKIHLTPLEKEKQPVPCKGWQCISESLLLEISENALPSGFPKRLKKFIESRDNVKQGLRYFTHPPKDLLQALTVMKTSNNQDDLAKYLTLSMIAVCGEKIKMEDVVNIEQSRNRCTVPPARKKTKKKTKSKSKAKPCEVESPWWIEIIDFYTKRCSKSMTESVKTGLDLLKTSYVKEEVKGVFVFAAPCVKNAVLMTIGQDFQQHILKLSDLQFFKEYVSIDYFGEDSDQFIMIDISDIALVSEANVKLTDLFESGDIESFSNHKLFRNKMFAQQFLDFFGKTHDWLKILHTNSSEKNLCVISCALQKKPIYLEGRQNNLAKAIVLHKTWNEKRKVYREWTSKKEYEVILHCCQYGDKDTYFELRTRYNVHVNYDCLQLAIKVGSYQIVEEVLDSIAAYMPDEQKCKCMELALFRYTENPLVKRRKVVNALENFVPVDYKIKGVDPFIHSATKIGDVRTIVALECFGGDINVTNEYGKNILHEAVQLNKAPFLDIALKHGADQKKADRQGMLPVHACAKQNKPYPLQILIEADNEIVSAKDNSGRQPLHHAAINNSYEAANCLILHGAEVNATDDGQKTPLHYAAESGKGAVLHSLLEAKADIFMQDNKGQSPWILACQERNLEGIKRLLRDGMVDVNIPIDKMFPIHMVASTGNVSTFQKLLDKGGNINEVTLDTNDTVLHIAIKHRHDKLVKTILEIDDSLVGYRNRENEVPLHIAARHGNLYAVDALLKAGADRSSINKRCQKPVCLIKEMLKNKTNNEEYERYFSIFRLLIGLRPRLETAV